MFFFRGGGDRVIKSRGCYYYNISCTLSCVNECACVDACVNMCVVVYVKSVRQGGYTARMSNEVSSRTVNVSSKPSLCLHDLSSCLQRVFIIIGVASELSTERAT